MDTYALSHLLTSKGIWCWAVNFKRRGRLHQMRFYETSHRSSARAHKAAVVWRDRELAKVGTLGKTSSASSGAATTPAACWACTSSATRSSLLVSGRPG